MATEQILSISLNDQDVLYTEIEKDADAYNLLQLGRVQTNLKFGIGIEGVEKNAKDLTSYINGLIGDKAITAKKLALSINNNLVIIEKVLVDSTLTDYQRFECLRWELEQHIDDTVDNYVLNTRDILSRNGVSEVLLVALRKRIRDVLYRTMNSTKLGIEALNVDIFASVNCAVFNYDQASQGMICLLGIKTGFLDISILENGKYRFFQQIVLPFKIDENKLLDFIGNYYNQAVRAVGADKALNILVYNNFAGTLLPKLKEKGYNAELFNPFVKLGASDEVENSEEYRDKFHEYAPTVGAALPLI